MYWQVYLHKTVLSFENTLIKILKRAKKLIKKGEKISCSKTLNEFLKNDYTINDFNTNKKLLTLFSKLDDHDIYSCLKNWINNKDFVISMLSQSIINRRPLKIIIKDEKFCSEKINSIRKKISIIYNISKNEAEYLVFSGKVSNNIYHKNNDNNRINILTKNSEIKDITDASDQFNLSVLNKTINKYFLCYPKHKLLEND